MEIRCCEDVYSYMVKHKRHKEERIYLITIDQGLNVIKKRMVFKGSVNACSFHPREVLHHAIKDLATGMFLVHNHPSGSLKISDQDLKVTSLLNKCCSLMGIKLLDHIIISKNGYTSIKSEEPDAFDTEFVY